MSQRGRLPGTLFQQYLLFLEYAQGGTPHREFVDHHRQEALAFGRVVGIDDALAQLLTLQDARAQLAHLQLLARIVECDVH